MKKFLKILKWTFLSIGLIIVAAILWFASVYQYEGYHIDKFENKEVFIVCQENDGMTTTQVKLYQDSTFLSFTGTLFSTIYVWGTYEISGDTLRFNQEYNEQSFLDCDFIIDEKKRSLNAKGCEKMTFYKK